MHTTKAGNNQISVLWVQMNAWMGLLSDVMTETLAEFWWGDLVTCDVLRRGLEWAHKMMPFKNVTAVRTMNMEKTILLSIHCHRFISFLLLVSGFLVQSRNVAAKQPPQGDAVKDAEFVAAIDVGHFELAVVDPQGNPIANAQVEVRSHPKPEWEILAGTFLRKARYGTFMRTDKQGRLRIKLPGEELSYLNCSIRARRYGPFWAGWSFKQKTEVLPASYTAHLDAGQSVGGVVVDADGKPVEGAEIHPSIEYKKRETDESQLGSGWTTKTDKDGRWRADCVPSVDRLSLEIVHPKFVPTRTSIVTNEYRLKLDETPREHIIIDRGVTLAGTVTDEDGHPIKDAKVRASLINEMREARTDAAGKYEMPGCPTGKMVTVTITATTFAPDQAEVEFRDAMQPLDFQLDPGKTIRVRVVDKDGKPEQKARIFFRRWRQDDYGHGLDTIHQYTDENGIWEWQEAPNDAIIVDVCPVGKLQIGDQTLIARDEEYVFTSSRQLTIEGMVVDAETGKPIELYRVVPGLKWPGHTKPHWSRRESFAGRSGKFHYKVSRMDASHLIRIEAPGYAPLVSRDVAASEGSVKFRWQLKKAENIEIKIERPDGSMAVGAEVAVGIPGAQIIIRNAGFTNTYAQRAKVDQDGLLKLNPEAGPFLLVVVDEHGYAEMVCEPENMPTSIRLTAWATITGQLQQGAQPGRHVALVYTPRDRDSVGNLPRVSWDYNAKTDDDGNFQFPRVLPGKGMLALQVRTHESDDGYRTQWSHARHISTQPGKPLDLTLGGDGRAVIGQAIASEIIQEQIDWRYAVIVAQGVIGDPPSIPYPPDLVEDQKEGWAKVWLQTPLGNKWQELNQHYNQRQIDRPRYVAAISKDRKFRLDDLPVGEYEVELLVEKRPTDRFGWSHVIASWEGTIEISETEDNGEPLDLGELVVLPK